MTPRALVSGTIFRQPEQRTSKTGKVFAIATVKVKDGEAAQWWRIIAFGDTLKAELLRLQDGDALTVQGSLKVETYQRDGETRLNLSCFADQILALRQPPKQKKEDAKMPATARSAEKKSAPAFNDDIPF